jgi:hypothetical protein
MRPMLLAGDRLKTSEDSVAEICTSLGYETESAFGRLFGWSGVAHRGNIVDAPEPTKLCFRRMVHCPPE